MRKHLRFLSVVLPFTVSSLVAACRLPEADAREHLEAEGMSKILLVKTDAGFDWTASSEDGARCSGSIRNESTTASKWAVTKSCSNG
jgi:hypothetical protein